jgi:hypothetical protein
VPHALRNAAAIAALLLAGSLAGCAGDAWAAPRASSAPLGAAVTGFIPTATPSPEATVHPPAGSWGDLRPAPGYRVVLLTAGDDAPTQTIVAAVRAWADATHADLRTVTAGTDAVPAAVSAMGMRPDLIVIAGDALVDPMAVITANHLDQQFLVVGAELAEPTANVTAADWTGASFRGEGLGQASAYDAATFTPERASAAMRAGVASILSRQTGVVLWID